MIGLLSDRTMDSEIKKEFVAVRADLRNVDERVREVDTCLSAEIRRVEATLRQGIREEGIATRRHFDVVAESLRDDIRIIAEGVIALDAKVETIRDSG
jgi:putative N-acetylmannosamine-6-phosphate epimerase